MNNLTNDINSFKPEDLRLPVPNDAFRKIVKYLDPQSIQAALQVNSYFARKTLKVTRVKQNSLIEDFARFLLGNLNPNLYQDQIDALLPFCETKKFLCLSNLIEIKSALSETKNVIINILKSLKLEDLNELKKLHLSQSKPDFFEDIFDIAIIAIIDAARGIKDLFPRNRALREVCRSFIKVNDINKAIELAHSFKLDLQIFEDISQHLIKLINQGKVEECINIFDTTAVDPEIKAEFFSIICESLAENNYFGELVDFINKTEVVGRGLNEPSLARAKHSLILNVCNIIIPLVLNKDNKAAIKLAYSLEDLSVKVHVFYLICQALTKENRLDQALAILDTLTPQLIPGLSPGTDNEILVAICTALLEIGNADKALEIIAARVHEEEMKANFLALISMGLAQTGNRARALEIAHTINIPALREQLLEQIHSIPS